MDILQKHQIKVLAVDNCPVITKGIVSFLLTEQHFFTINTASNIKESLVLTREWRPDIIIIDLALLLNDFIGKLKLAYPGVKIIVFMEQSSKNDICTNLIKGAHGLLLKNCSQNEMIEAILKVYTDKIYLSRGLTSSESMLGSSSANKYSSDNINLVTTLTNREREVLALMSEGLHNKEIAARLGIKNRTVEFHTSNILSKLGASTRTQAVSIYYKNIVLQ